MPPCFRQVGDLVAGLPCDLDKGNQESLRDLIGCQIRGSETVDEAQQGAGRTFSIRISTPEIGCLALAGGLVGLTGYQSQSPAAWASSRRPLRAAIH